MSYSKELIEDIYSPEQPAKVSVKLTNPNMPNIPVTSPLQATAADIDVGGALVAGKDALEKTIDYAASKSKGAGSDVMSGALSSLGTTLSKPKNLAALGAGALATGALIGGGLALGRRIGNIGSKKDKKKLNEKSKKDDLYYRQVDFDPYAPRYTVPQLATTAGGITGTTAGSIYGSKVGTALGGPVGGLLGAGIGGALGGAAGSIGAYQLAKMARPKKKKKLVQYYR
jgi:hypothetical protein